MTSTYRVLQGDSRDVLKDLDTHSIDCIFTSPDPIRLYRDLVIILQILGQECRRVLKPTGSIWVSMEDAYNEEGSLMRWPAKFTCEMVYEYGWILRSERIWHLPVGGQGFFNGGRVIDNNRLILDHSYVYHFTNSRYDYYNTFADFGGQPCSIFTEKAGPHFSLELIKQSLLMSCPIEGTVLDPFCGGGTTGEVALGMVDKKYFFLGIEKLPERVEIARKRLAETISQ